MQFIVRLIPVVLTIQKGYAFLTYRHRMQLRPLSLSSHLRGNFVSVRDCVDAFTAAEQDRSSISTHSSQSKLVFIDGSWYIGKDRSARSEYEAGPRIAGAKFFDIDDFSSKGPLLNPKNLPHMMPPKQLFASVMDALGIDNSDTIVVYGVEGCLFSTRAWYTLREMGHASDRIHLMQGTLHEWMDQGGKVDYGPISAVKADDLSPGRGSGAITFNRPIPPSKDSPITMDLTVSSGTILVDSIAQTARYQAIESTSMVPMDTVRSIVMGESFDGGIIVDARSEGRFKGIAPEPRPGLRGGRMPRSFNVPATDLLDGSKYLPVENMIAVFEKAGVAVGARQKIICSCGSGVTACVIAAALLQCGRDPRNTFIFDGSWIEWASDLSNPVENESKVQGTL